MMDNDTIVALATAQGVGAIAVIRLSGKDAISITAQVFNGTNLLKVKSHTVHYGYIVEGEKQVDEVMVTVFRAPKSFTTEDIVEISCHGSPFITEQILRLLIQHGGRNAKPGEFTMRAFLNGRIDLSQAEAVADLIASNSAAAHDLAIKQMRGGFSNNIKDLRDQLVTFASLLELELDFSEEDVEFADRTRLTQLINTLRLSLHPLIESFKLGNVIKYGVNTVIAGRPNAGKSTLLNALLNEDRAIVSEIAGTTRDTIEEVINIKGLQFRFIDTAGIRNTADVIEKIGVEKAREKLRQSSVYIYLFDVNNTTPEELAHDIHELKLLGFTGIIAGNKIDKAKWQVTAPFFNVFDNIMKHHRAEVKQHTELLFISSNTHYNLQLLKDKLYTLATRNLKAETQDTIVTNLRHYDALLKADEVLQEVKMGMESKNTTELLALDIKRALAYLGEISGEVTNDEILGTIFSKFCIGK